MSHRQIRHSFTSPRFSEPGQTTSSSSYWRPDLPSAELNDYEWEFGRRSEELLASWFINQQRCYVQPVSKSISVRFLMLFSCVSSDFVFFKWELNSLAVIGIDWCWGWGPQGTEMYFIFLYSSPGLALWTVWLWSFHHSGRSCYASSYQVLKWASVAHPQAQTGCKWTLGALILCYVASISMLCKVLDGSSMSEAVGGFVWLGLFQSDV